MGVLHAAYGKCDLSFIPFAFLFIDTLFFFFSGLGAFASPLVATQFAQLPNWSFHFLVSLGFAISNAILLIAVFRLKRQDGTYIWYISPSNLRHLYIRCRLYHSHKRFFPECLLQAGEIIPETTANSGSEGSGTFKKVITTRAVHLLALFILIYVGVEVTIGGEVISLWYDQRPTLLHLTCTYSLMF